MATVIEQSVKVLGPPLTDVNIAGTKRLRFMYDDAGATKIGMTSVTLDGTEDLAEAQAKAVVAANTALGT